MTQCLHAHTHASAFRKAASLSDIEALADRLEPALARAIRDTLKEHAARVDLDELEAALKAGNAGRVIEIVGAVDPLKAGAVKAALENTVWAGGAMAAAGETFVAAQFVFNRLNPALVTWLETYSLNLIREMDKGTLEAVRAQLIVGMREGQNPIQQARAIKTSVGLTAKQAAGVASYRKELESFHLKRGAKSWGLSNERSRQSGLEVMPLGPDGKPLDGIEARRLRDLRYDAKLARAMETRTPLKPEEIDKMVARYQERYLQHRARTIARTEAIRACNVGVSEAWRQASESGAVDGSLTRKLWILSSDERLCPICKAIPGANPKRGVPVDGYFASPKGQPLKLPPAHPNCRCTVFVRLWEPEQLAPENNRNAA